jgi:Domain of unknown function (DUF4920)
MKNLFIIITICLFAKSVNGQTNFGAKIKQNKKALPANEVASTLGNNDKAKIRVTGVVEDVCQAKGCWMKVTTDNGKSMRVTFKDYAFFVPKDIAGKKVIFEGTAYKTVTSIADLKHYALDAGKTEAEITKITKPESEITFEADGVIVKN